MKGTKIYITIRRSIILFVVTIVFVIPFSDLDSIDRIHKNVELSSSYDNLSYRDGWILSQNKMNNKKKSKAQGKISKKGRKKTKYFTLNFKDVEISEFLNVMSDLIGKNIIIDDKVRGKITISSAKKVPVKEAFNILKSILELKGLAVVESQHLIKIIPVKDAIKKNVEVIIDEKETKRIPLDEEKTITYLLEIEHADANEISSALKSMKSKNTDIVVYSILNIIIFSGKSTEISGLVKIAKALDKPIDEIDEEKIVKGNIHVVHLENADAESLAGVLSRIPFSEQALTAKQRPVPKVRKSSKSKRVTKTQAKRPGSQSKTKLSIIANKETNSLIITATPEEFREIRRIIKELDIVREQVLIECLIVEVSAEKGWSLGIDWMGGYESDAGDMYGGSSILGIPPNYSSEGLSSMGDKKIAIPLASGFQIGFLSGEEMLGFALLNMFATDKNFNILSTPQILTVDNNEAELNVGEEIPVATNNRISESGTQFFTYEYKSVGIKLKITPHITNKERITLELYQEANDVLGGTTTGSAIPPKLSKRDISTKVTVGDGKTIVVGGLIRNNKVEEESKVPILGDIPILGWLFKRKSVDYKKTNLLVFITPFIVTKQERIDAVTNRKREEQRRLRTR
ncbi:MAG: secretin N-terminal domain-containing protein [Spirochaetota bacterium]|nr:secretin N-terminal domain-containing protein [Spirochaetota bacterium]